jgi:hypothetical protein
MKPGGCVNIRPALIIEPLNLAKRENPDDQCNPYHPSRFAFNCCRAGHNRYCHHPGQRRQRVRGRPDIRGDRVPQNRPALRSNVSRGSALEEELPGEKTRSWIMVWEQTIVETDDPRSIDSVREIDRTSDAATDAAYGLASIAPTTMAGVVGLLQYAVSIQPEEWSEGVQSDDDTETRPWHYFMIEMLIAVLPGMAMQS